jgi:hypothetical protein
VRIKAFVLHFIFATTSLQAWGQALISGEMRFNIGEYAQTNLTDTAIIFPKFSSKVALKGLNFWLTGQIGADTLGVFTNIFSNRTDWTRGTSSADGLSHISSWPRSWKVNQSEIRNHLLSYMNQGYTPPKDFISWPSKVNATGFPSLLAGFVDYDNNGSYNSASGDYPYVLGEENVLIVATDSFIKGSYKNKPFPVDATVLFYSKEEEKNVVFGRLTICNRSLSNISNLRFSSVLDGQIGEAFDDAMSTHIDLNAISIYNGQSIDAIYGVNWPAISMVFLNRKLASSVYTKNNSSNVFGPANTNIEFYNYAHAKWLSGKNVTYGGSGVDGTISTNYIYTGYSDTIGGKAPWFDNVDIGKRTIIASSEDINIISGDCKIVDFALVLSENAPNYSDIRSNVKSVIDFYAEQGYNLDLQQVYSKKAVSNTLVVQSGGDLGLGDDYLYLFNLNGQLMSQGNSCKAPLNAGLYLIKFKDLPSQMAVKLLVTN